jgi:hypothetical protein
MVGTEGTTGLPAGGEMDFVDYTNADETALLSFERWGPRHAVGSLDGQVRADRRAHRLPCATRQRIGHVGCRFINCRYLRRT